MGIAAAFFAAAYLHFYVSTVTFINESGQPLSDVRIQLSEKLIWRGDLALGASKWAFGIPEIPGSLTISYKIDGRDVEHFGGYVSGGPSEDSWKYTLKADGTLSGGRKRAPLTPPVVSN